MNNDVRATVDSHTIWETRQISIGYSCTLQRLLNVSQIELHTELHNEDIRIFQYKCLGMYLDFLALAPSFMDVPVQYATASTDLLSLVL